MKSPIVLLSSLLEDFQRLNPGVKGLDRDLVTIKKRYENEGYGFLAVALPSLCDALVQGLTTGKFTCPMGFKPEPRWRAIPQLFVGMFSEIFDIETGTLKEAIDHGVLGDLYQILKVLKKVQLSPKNEEILHSKAVDGFYQCDDQARQVEIPDRQDHLIGRVSSLLLPTLNYKDVGSAIYKHGPGAIEEGFKSNQKWSELAASIREDRHVPEWCNLRGVFDSSWYDQLDDQRFHELLGSDSIQGARSSIANGGGDRRTNGTCSKIASLRDSKARLISVPKSATSRRTITIEPMLNQFVQQGLNTLLRDSINECRILSLCLDLTDQAKNQSLALSGSLTRNWATLDLKSASDLLSLKLVRSVFRNHPDFLSRLEECRSTIVKSGGQPDLTLGKFAGMGNATTFPVQSICFAVVCIAAILDTWGVTPTYWRVRRASRQLRIYGDDIIVDAKYAHQCVNWLQDVGLRVNDKKSFLTGNFRESCGVDAYKGVELTPAYCRFRPEDIDDSPSAYAGFVSFSNHLWKLGLYKASTWAKELVEGSIGRALPLVHSQSGALGWHTRQEAVTPHRWCKRTHQFLQRTYVLTPRKRRDKLDGYGALLKCLHNKTDGLDEKRPYLFPEAIGTEKDHLSMTVIRFKPRMTRRWVPTLTSVGF